MVVSGCCRAARRLSPPPSVAVSDDGGGERGRGDGDAYRDTVLVVLATVPEPVVRSGWGIIIADGDLEKEEEEDEAATADVVAAAVVVENTRKSWFTVVEGRSGTVAVKL